MPPTDTITWLQDFLTEHSNGDWEHQYGISVASLDNPGWDVRIDLSDTSFENVAVQDINETRSDIDWIIVRREANVLIGSGGPRNLTEIFERLQAMLT